LIMAIMITIKAAFTLTGLAGLVLTVGMAVDANVLIFERIREELTRGAALRMAIRNGFARATTTIVDANLTTLITATVLYAIGTDQVRGFAVTLWLGVVLSMFTAIFCSRVLFDIAERRRWISKLTMMRILRGTKIDFLGKRRPAAVVSACIILIGLVGVSFRGKGLLDIDFTGGVSVTVVFDGADNDVSDVRKALSATRLEDLSISDMEVQDTQWKMYRVNAREPERDQAVRRAAAVAAIEKQLGEVLSDDAQRKKVADTVNGQIDEIFDAESAQERFAAVDTALQQVSRIVPDDLAAEQRDALLACVAEQLSQVHETATDLVEKIIIETFPGQLATNTMTIETIVPIGPESPQSLNLWRNRWTLAGIHPAAMMLAQPAPAEDPADDLAETPDEGEPEVPADDAEPTPPEDGEPATPPADPPTTPEDGEPADPPVDPPTTPGDGEPADPPVDPPTTPGDGEPADPPVTSPADPSTPPPADPPETPAVAPTVPADPFAGGTLATVSFARAVDRDTLLEMLKAQLRLDGIDPTTVRLQLTQLGEADETAGEAESNRWEIRLGLAQPQADTLLGEVKTTVESTPFFPSSNTIGGKVAGNMQRLAMVALVASLLCIVGYIWIRFQRVVFGLAAVVALVHDVLITLGVIALSAFVADYLGFLAIEEFKIGLPVLAAFLTIIGYSLNDTIVVFDRIREVRGRAPRLTEEMVNTSINQTLSRTLLTSLTTLLVVGILYFWGGQGIHAFAFSLVIGVIVGTYSSIFVASPALLWMSRQPQTK